MSRVILFVLLSFVLSAQAQSINHDLKVKTSFEKTEQRYPSVLAILENLRRLAPHLPELLVNGVAVPDVMLCQSVHADSVNVMGANDPAQIQPLDNLPGALFFHYFENCARKIIHLGFSQPSLARKNAELILGPLTKNLPSTDWASIQFTKLSLDLQNQVMDRFFLFIIGPEELFNHFKYIGLNNVFQIEIKTQADLREFLRLNLIQVEPEDSLLGFYTRLATLLRLGPILRN